MGFAGLTGGVLFDLFLNGFPATETTLFWSIGGAVFMVSMLVVLHFLGESPVQVKKASLQPKPQVPRSESSGTFKERLSQFAENVDDQPSTTNVEPIEFWASGDSDEYEPIPPKPIGIIRFLLQRIQRILAGN